MFTSGLEYFAPFLASHWRMMMSRGDETVAVAGCMNGHPSQNGNPDLSHAYGIYILVGGFSPYPSEKSWSE